VPVGSDAFITNYVCSKALDIVQDVDKLNIMKDPLTKHHLLKYCQHPRLDFLGRNVSPSQMTTPVNGIVGPQAQHVDWAVIQAILKVGTAGQFDTLQPDMKKWCKHVITLPYHLGGFGITPLVQSCKAGFYSATAKFISWLGTLPNAQFWLHHDLHQPDTWSVVMPTSISFH
jgi:hypothetical protein